MLLKRPKQKFIFIFSIMYILPHPPEIRCKQFDRVSGRSKIFLRLCLTNFSENRENNKILTFQLILNDFLDKYFSSQGMFSQICLISFTPFKMGSV